MSAMQRNKGKIGEVEVVGIVAGCRYSARTSLIHKLTVADRPHNPTHVLAPR